MKTGTLITGTLIVSEDYFNKYNASLETRLSAEISSLKTAINKEGIELYELSSVRELSFTEEHSEGVLNFMRSKLKERPHYDKQKVLTAKAGKYTDKQLRQNFKLVTTKPLTKNQIFSIINQFKPMPLKFYNGAIKLK